ncbi:MAG: hypothetical protein D6696_02165 [Acidobacteria bacterium]|nr:MAG: hypothetical protein D6696_02165 [Acidobacteriota bacterium]
MVSGISMASVLALLAAASGAASPTGPLAVGRPVPDLVLPDAGGGAPRSLAEWRGRRYVLHVFASW